jgi:hypothetical protein
VRGDPPSQPGHSDRLQNRLELRGVTPLLGRDHDGQPLLPLLDGEVDLGGEPAPGPSESMIGRLDGDSTGRLPLQVPLFAAPAAC